MSDATDLQNRIARAWDIVDHYGGIDGAHHKQWVLDQVVRALTGCPLEKRTTLDANKQPYTYDVQGVSEEYAAWVKAHCDGEDGPNTYEWDVGIAP